MKAHSENDKIIFELTKSEAIVLCELLCRFTDTDKLDIVDKAEAQILWNMCGLLEKSAEDIFSSEWEEVVQMARNTIKSKTE